MLENAVETMRNSMIPSVCDYFRSFYYSNTYMDPVDLDQDLPTKYACPDDNVRQMAQRTMSSPEVQKLFSDPLSFERPVIDQKNAVLERNGFQILGQKAANGTVFPFYNVAESPDLPGWVLKATGDRVPKDLLLATLVNDQHEVIRFSSYESLLRLKMNQRLREECNDVFIPKEYAIPYSDHVHSGSDISRSYFIISEKLDVLSHEETVQAVKRMSNEKQVQLAQRIVPIVKKGYADAGFPNIRLTRNGALAIVDTEPVGLFVYKNDPDVKRGHTVEKCARVGLFMLKTYAAQMGLYAFSKEVDRHYQASLSDYSVTKIILSILCPLIPLVLLIIAVINTQWIGQVADEIAEKGIQFGTSNTLTALLNPQRFQEEMKKYIMETRVLQEQYNSAIDGVPFASANPLTTLATA